MTEFERMAELLLPNIDKTPEHYESLDPARNLSEGARVVRIAPSPTGYLHLGTLFAALVNRITATSTDGVFFTRIEDTDKKREIEGGIEDIIDGLNRFGITIDEGFVSGTKESGEYGPYQQSKRAEIYQTYVKGLISQGLAYPCFCTAEELEAVREIQEKNKIRTGYHGEYARHRDITVDEAAALIKEGKPYVVRLKSPGSEENRIAFDDGIKGKIEMPENDEDFVLLKSDGIPTYHFAHAVDDHLMHTTHVIRGDEWISSVPKHIQLFKLLGFKPPKYAHVAPIMKLDNGAKRKISKRKDPEAALTYYHSQGYPVAAVREYLMTILNSNFEEWRLANPDAPIEDFKFTTKKMSVSGSLFDLDKLNDVSKNVISRMTAEEVYDFALAWAKENDTDFASVLESDKDYAVRILSIGRGGKKPRKDIALWSEVKNYMSFFYDNLFQKQDEIPDNFSKDDIKAVLADYKEIYNKNDDQNQWFGNIKAVAEKNGFCPDMKQYKASPESFKGSVADVSMFLRIAVTGRMNSPDLYEVMKILGREKVLARVSK